MFKTVYNNPGEKKTQSKVLLLGTGKKYRHEGYRKGWISRIYRRQNTQDMIQSTAEVTEQEEYTPYKKGNWS